MCLSKPAITAKTSKLTWFKYAIHTPVFITVVITVVITITHIGVSYTLSVSTSKVARSTCRCCIKRESSINLEEIVGEYEPVHGI